MLSSIKSAVSFVLRVFSSKHIKMCSSVPADPLQWTSLSDVTVEDDQQTWQRDAEPRDTRAPLPVAASSSLSDLRTLYRSTSGRQQSPSRLSDPSGGSTVLEEQDAASNWSISSRKKRNFSLGVAGMCCSQGCTKNDIGRLCWGRREGGWWWPDVELGSVQSWRTPSVQIHFFFANLLKMLRM